MLTRPRRIPLTNPPRTSIFQAPKVKRLSVVWQRANTKAPQEIAGAVACVLMCQPSANRAMELNIQPATISTSIMATVSKTTRMVFFSVCSPL